MRLSPFRTGGAGDSGPLIGSNFGFAIPTGATINGITVSLVRKQTHSGTGVVKTGAVFLYKAGVPVGTPKIGTSYYVNSNVTETWGGTTDLWGASWNNNDINDPGFSFSMNVAYEDTDLADTAEIQAYSVTISWVVATSNHRSHVSEPCQLRCGRYGTHHPQWADERSSARWQHLQNCFWFWLRRHHRANP